MKTGTTCLIPFYNESYRLIETLKIISQIETIDEIICIDDGSKDNTVILLNRYFPEIKLIRLDHNQGKTEAIRQGFKSARTKYTLLLDADLKNLSVNEIEKAISLIIKKPEIDMLILQRINEPFFVRLFRFDVILSGQRIIKTDILEEILNENISHYDLEVAMNEYAKNHKLKVACFSISAINTGRRKKWGSKRSLSTNISMLIQFSKNPGLINILKQMLYFARD